VFKVIEKKIYSRKYNAKCDCCKRVTLIKGKMEISDPADSSIILGELQLCAHCMPVISSYLLDNPKPIEVESDPDDIYTEINFEAQPFDPKDLPPGAIEL
jgi:hypothetical protein